MSSIIQHNISAQNTYRHLKNNTNSISSSLEKLSSGYQINRSADNAAGLAISEKMRCQITNLEAAMNNVEDGISLIHVGDGALQEVHDIINRMDELAVLSANGTFDDDVDRAALQLEVDSLIAEINRISEATNFNGIQLLNGGSDLLMDTYQIDLTDGIGVDALISSSNPNLSDSVSVVTNYSTIVDSSAISASGNSPINQSITVNGTTVNYWAYPEDEEHLTAASIQESFDIAGIDISVYSLEDEYGNMQIGFDLGSDAEASISVNGNAVSTDEINIVYESVNLDSFGHGDSITINGDTFVLWDETVGSAPSDAPPTYYLSDNSSDSAVLDRNFVDALAYAGANVSVVNGETILMIPVAFEEIEDSDGIILQIGDTNQDYQQLVVPIHNVHATYLDIDPFDIATQDSALDAMSKALAAINQVSGYRSEYGALENRLEHTFQVLSNTTENIQAAESTIRDTDMAEEMMAYTKSNILIQSSQSMLAHSNQQPEGVLQLLG